jgi:UDP-N-acetylglucosamine--N-acetylmuramyl-(pentapeptide) pyrophosphoryl-undecaprenol N-acetylglucosamine transferase
MIEDKRALQDLVPQMIELSRDVTKQNIMKENIQQLKITNADDCIANEIMAHLK